MLLPEGKTRVEAKHALKQYTGVQDRAKSVLFWALDQADTYTLRVKEVCEVYGWGEKKWKTARDGLVMAGLMEQHKTVDEDGSTHWSLIFKLHQVFIHEELSTTPQKAGTTRARVIPPKRGGHLILPKDGDQVIPQKGGDLNLKINLKNKRQQDSGGDAVEKLYEVQELQIPKRVQGSRQQIEHLTAGLPFEKGQELLDEMEGQGTKVRHPLVWLGSMCRRTRAGEILVLGYAQGVAEVRAARAAAAAREAAAMRGGSGPPRPPEPPEPPEAAVPSVLALAERQRLREMRKGFGVARSP